MSSNEVHIRGVRAMLGTHFMCSITTYTELPDDELAQAMKDMLTHIGITPHGECVVEHFTGYLAPPSAAHFIGEDELADGNSGESAVQFIIDSNSFPPHSRTAIQPAKSSHAVMNYGWRTGKYLTASVDIFSCGEFDVEKAKSSIMLHLHGAVMFWELAISRPL